MRMPDSLAEKILKASGAVTDEKLLELKAEVKSSHVPLAELILHYGIMSEEELSQALARAAGLPFVKLISTDLKPAHLGMLPEPLSRRHRIIVFDIKPDKTKLVASDTVVPPSAQAVLAKALGPNYELHLTTPATLHTALEVYRHHGLAGHQEMPKATNKATWSDPKVLESIHYILEQAILKNASSIHIEPRARTVSVRFRIDGVLKEAYKLPISLSSALSNRLKAMAGLSGAAPSEGQFKIDSHHQIYRIEVLSLPVVNGEKVTLNLFNESLKVPALQDLGLWGSNLVSVEHSLVHKRGLFLVSGPRDSGKTTTLYSLLEALNVNNLNVLSIEDKLTFRLSGISQLELGPRLPTYEIALAAALKQNPEVLLTDKILSSNIADRLTEFSTNALVLAGVNANDPFSCLGQLERLGVESFRLAHAAQLVLSVRAVRKLCDQCKEPIHPSNDTLKALVKAVGLSNVGGIKALHQLEKQAANDGVGELKKTDLSSTETSIKRLFTAKDGGCAHCNYTGYRGRIGLQEVLHMTDEVKAKLAAGADTNELSQQALKSGFLPLLIDGLIKSLRGLTSIEEVPLVH